MFWKIGLESILTISWKSDPVLEVWLFVTITVMLGYCDPIVVVVEVAIVLVVVDSVETVVLVSVVVVVDTVVDVVEIEVVVVVVVVIVGSIPLPRKVTCGMTPFGGVNLVL